MREIKFRAWDIKNKEMVEVRDISFDLIGRIEEVNTSTYCWREDYYNYIALMQFTGLKDKNGKEIYEGDIVKCEQHPLYEVKWHNDRCGFSPFNLYGGEIFEVIGNIYENPELTPNIT